ncbi:MAG: hypothetical protein ACRDDY_09320 [Clostridium sp.]|uniref:hypothetical protein n=1 Tax=Clostridium sp. TaxID=1506 RepID=UPI003EE81029
MSNINSLDSINKDLIIKPTNSISKLWDNPYTINFYFFISEQAFKNIMPKYTTVYDFLEEHSQGINYTTSLLVQAAWIISGGPQQIGKMLGGSVSISMGMIESAIEDEYTELVNIASQAVAACSKYDYPRSSWELIHQTTWSYFPGRPHIIDSSWTFQGTNDPFKTI